MSTAAFSRMSRLADQVHEESKDLDPSKVALTLLMVLPFLLGWLLGQVWRLVWAILAWTWTALAVGFRTAHGGGKDAPG